MTELAVSPTNGDGLTIRSLRAPPAVKRSRNFGITPPRLDAIETVGIGAGYDPRIAYLTSVISGWAYSDADTMARQLPYYGLPDCTVHEFRVVNRAMLIVASAYFVRSADGAVGVLAFRGTVPDDAMNWLTDANTTLRKFHFGRVHAGFFENVEPLWSDIAEKIEDAINPSTASKDEQNDGRAAKLKPLQDLYITGHSLGAAMAVIAAARIFANDYASWQPLIRGVYTFGQPAAGDRDFARHYEGLFNLYRHVYRSDLVPHVPPRSVGEFVHFGAEFSTNRSEDGWQNINPPLAKVVAWVSLTAIIAAVDFLSRRVVLLRRLKLPYSMDDHGPEGYIQTSRCSL